MRWILACLWEDGGAWYFNQYGGLIEKMSLYSSLEEVMQVLDQVWYSCEDWFDDNQRFKIVIQTASIEPWTVGEEPLY